MKKKIAILLSFVLLFSLAACGTDNKDMVSELGLTAESKDATEYTVQVNSALYSTLDFEDKTEYEFATKGLIDAPESLEIKDADGMMIDLCNKPMTTVWVKSPFKMNAEDMIRRGERHDS